MALTKNLRLTNMNSFPSKVSCFMFGRPLEALNNQSPVMSV